jgi:hypothetical protein
MDVTANNRLDVDAQTEVDGLERSRFTKDLLDVLMQVNAEQGAVVGLEGEWGSGKTWVLRQLEPLAEAPVSERQLLFLHFNPWMVSGAHDLVAAMLSQLSKQLAEQGRKSTTGPGKPLLTKAVKAIDKYAGALTAVKHAAPAFNLLLPGAGIVVGGIAAGMETVGEVARKVVPALPEAAAKKSLPALRDEIRNALKAFNRKIVVVIDDLDRITPSEIAAMVQAIKAVADFPNVVYLLAYERDTLAHALERALDVKDGGVYLEKIVQVPVQLPDLPAQRIQTFAEKRLKQVLNDEVRRLPEASDVDWAVSLAAALLHTPRGAVRLATRLAIVQAEMCGHVNLADVIAAEALRLAVPGWLPWMRTYGSLIVEAGLVDDAQAMRGQAGFYGASALHPVSKTATSTSFSATSVLEIALPAGVQRRPYVEALRFVFDILRAGKGSGAERKPVLRLNRYRNWYRWLCLCDHQEPMTPPQLRAYANDPGEARRDGYFSSPEQVDLLLRHFADVTPEDLGSFNAVQWVEALVAADKKLERFLTSRPLKSRLSFEVVLRLLQRAPDDQRKQAIQEFLRNGSLDLGAELLMAVSPPGSALTLLPSVDLREEADRWLIRLNRELPRWCSEQANDSDYGPLLVLNRIADRPFPLHEIHDLSLALLARTGTRLQHFFGPALAGKYPTPLPWVVLPSPNALVARIEAESEFEQSHSAVCEMIRAEAQATSEDRASLQAHRDVEVSRQSGLPPTPPPAPDHV